MDSFNQALHIIRYEKTASAHVFEQVILALQHDHPLHPTLFDQLGYEDCRLALQLILDWRVVRHYYARL